METLPQVLVKVPAAPPRCRGALTERARLHWHRHDGGDPATIAEDFLAAHGLPLHDLTRPAPTHSGTAPAAPPSTSPPPPEHTWPASPPAHPNPRQPYPTSSS
ncbi:hypothetical protein GCM10027614_10300 [Micromonospora vulcania]